MPQVYWNPTFLRYQERLSLKELDEVLRSSAEVETASRNILLCVSRLGKVMFVEVVSTAFPCLFLGIWTSG